MPEPFGDICLPKFEIFVKNCCISITYCSTSRLQADMLVLLYGSQNFDHFQAYKPEDYFISKEQGDRLIKDAQKGQNIGSVALVNTHKSSFKTLAFMKMSNPYESSFNKFFNLGLSKLFSQGNTSTKSVVLPYCDKLGSSKEKAKQLIDLMRTGSKGFEQIVINCTDLASFKRMVEGFSTVVSQYESELKI